MNRPAQAGAGAEEEIIGRGAAGQVGDRLEGAGERAECGPAEHARIRPGDVEIGGRVRPQELAGAAAAVDRQGGEVREAGDLERTEVDIVGPGAPDRDSRDVGAKECPRAGVRAVDLDIPRHGRRKRDRISGVAGD